MSGIDDTAGFALARATRTHKTLTSLDLSHNAITAAATMVRWPQVAVLCLSWPYPRAVVGSDARIGGSGVPDAEDRVLGCMQPWPPRSPSHCTRAHATRRAHGVSAVPRVHGWVQHDGAWSGYRHHCDLIARRCPSDTHSPPAQVEEPLHLFDVAEPGGLYAWRCCAASHATVTAHTTRVWRRYELDLGNLFDQYVLRQVIGEVSQLPGAAIVGNTAKFKSGKRAREVNIEVRGACIFVAWHYGRKES